MLEKPVKVHLEILTESSQYKGGIELQGSVRASLGMQYSSVHHLF